MRFIVFICLAFLIVSQYFCFCEIHPDDLAEIVGINAKIDEMKSKKPKEILKNVITDLEKCAKTGAKSKEIPAVTKVVLKCLSDIKKQQNFLDKRDKKEKDGLTRKVVIKLVECINKSKISPKKYLDNIPPELMEGIIRNMTPHELLSSMLYVCPKFRNDIIWMFEAIQYKSKEPKEILKKVITDLEKCAKTKKDAVTKVVLKCLSDIKRQQNFLDKKAKTEKDISKKVVTKLAECINKSRIPPKKSLDHIPPEIMEETFRTTTPHTLLSFMADICPKFSSAIKRITWITESWLKLPTEADLRRQ